MIQNIVPRWWVTLLVVGVASLDRIAAEEAVPPRPNLLWITLEDLSPDLGCYGDPQAVTPAIDAFASEGVRYTRVWSNAGMCAPARATLITGMYASSTGAQNMRSDVRLPEEVRAFPEYLRRAGYFCSNHVKTDYNWTAPESTWDIQHLDWSNQGWRRRAAGQPFLTVINITDTHSSQIYHRGEANWRRRVSQMSPRQLHSPDEMRVPPYYPDVPEVRGDLARYYDNLSFADGLVDKILRQLDEDGLADNTIVFLFSDHGRGMPRTKGWCFETSLRVPLIIRFPDAWKHLAPAEAGATVDRMVAFVDFAATVLSLADVPIPDHFQGRAFLGSQMQSPATHAFAYRDRMDERYELIRAVTDGRYKYIRNYFPHLPWFHEQTRNYPSSQPSYLRWHEMARAGELTGPAAIYMAHQKPAEQLFDLEADPNELVNLAESAEHQETLFELRGALRQWMLDVRDLGFMPESQWFTRSEAAGDARPRHTIVRQSPDEYPLPQILAAAELVGSEGIPVMREQTDMLASDDPAVRYWGAIGLLAHASIGDEQASALSDMLADPIPSCRIAAAQALLFHREDPAPLQVLWDASAGDQPYVSLLAANALDHLGHRVAAFPGSARPRPETTTAQKDAPKDWIEIAREAMLDRVRRSTEEQSLPWIDWVDSSLSRWRGYQMPQPPTGWIVRDGVVTRRFEPGQEPTEFAEGGGDLITRETFGDFEFEFEFKIPEGGNSGVIYRLSEDAPRSYWTGPEYQILERADRKRNPALHFCGSNYALDGPPEDFGNGPGEWNRGRIVARGNLIEHWLNGHRTAAYEIGGDRWTRKVAESKFQPWPDYALRRRGHLALQDHGSPVEFRNLRIRVLEP